jgi:NodT family efflux transporter outer membrane factor (OMF) lipoprotein
MPAAFEHATRTGEASVPGDAWYGGFGSAELDGLLEEALEHNFDLAAAAARLAQADARARQAHAALLPSVDANGNANYLAGHSSAGSAHETDWAGLLSASYEVDFWGKNRAAADAARDRANASRADRETVRLGTLAAVASEYFDLMSLRERIAIARQNVEAASSLMSIVEARFHAGLANPVEVANQRSVLADARLVIPELEQREEEALASLAILVGRPPEGFHLEGTPLDALLEPEVGVGLPADLLQRRPDIVTAESDLAAAGADLVTARAALFPSLNLTAAGGVQNPAVNAAVIALEGTGPTLSLAGSLTQPIFDGGRLRAARDEAQAKVQEATAAYRAAILAALRDVENALGAYSRLQAARELHDEALAESSRAYEGARLRYQAGSGDFLTVLEAQRVLYTARDQTSQYRLARLQALVSLNKALGGGWPGRSGAPTAARQRDPSTHAN